MKVSTIDTDRLFGQKVNYHWDDRNKITTATFNESDNTGLKNRVIIDILYDYACKLFNHGYLDTIYSLFENKDDELICGTAVCSSVDTYDRAIGATIARQHLYQKVNRLRKQFLSLIKKEMEKAHNNKMIRLNRAVKDLDRRIRKHDKVKHEYGIQPDDMSHDFESIIDKKKAAQFFCDCMNKRKGAWWDAIRDMVKLDEKGFMHVKE